MASIQVIGWTLKRVIEAFILPPGLFVLLAAVAALLTARRRRGGEALLLAAIASIIWILSMPAAAGSLIERLESGLSIPADPRGDVIVLLGGGLDEWAQDMTGAGVPQPEMMSRMVTAARLQRRTGLPLIASEGRSRKGGPAADSPVARILRDLGVPGDRLIPDTRSLDTGDNARFTREICRERGFERPVLVTSAMHMKRSVWVFKRAGLDVTPYPAAFRSGDSPLGIRDFLPTSTDVSAALHEIIGLLYYRLSFRG